MSTKGAPKELHHLGVGVPKNDNQTRGRLHPVFIVILLCCAVAVTLLLYSNQDINWKKMSFNKHGSSNISTNVYNEAFNNGVNCGVEALMFFVKQGKKEIDINAVHIKATELRKNGNKK